MTILYGRYDPGAFNPTLSIELWFKLDFIAHCLTEEETQKFYPNASKNIEVINNKLLAAFLGEYIHIYPIFMVNKTETFSVEQYLWLQDPQKRINHFREVTDKITATRFVIVPWMSRIEEKSLLYTSFS